MTVHRVAEHGSMGPSAECTWQRGETESLSVWARGVFCRGESADRGHVHLCTKGSTPVATSATRTCTAWSGAWCRAGEKHPSWVGFDGEGPTSSVKRGDARDGREDVPNEVTAVDGREGPPLFPPINPLAVAAGELEESLLGPLPGGIEARPRSEGAEARTVSLIRPGFLVGDGEATPRIARRYPRTPSRRRSSSQRHDQGKSDCRLQRRLASVVKEKQSVREELGCGQSARQKMLMTVAERTMQQVMLLEARKSKRSRKHNKKTTRKTENDVIFSELDGKWCEFGRGVRGSGSRAKQRRNGSIEAVPRGAPQVLSPDHESIVGGDGLIDGWPCGVRGRHYGPEVPSPRVRSHRRGVVEHSEALGTGPSGRSHVSHPRAARRHESPGAPRSTVDRETKQLGLVRARSESQPTGREGRRQGRTPVEVARREPVRERKQKGEQDLGEHRTDSWQQRVAGWEETQTGVGACSESGKRQTLNEEPPVARGWLRDLPAKGPLPQHGVYIGRSHGAFYQPQGLGNPFKPDPREGKQGLQEVLDAHEQHLSQSQILLDPLPELSGKVLYCHCKPADP